MFEFLLFVAISDTIFLILQLLFMKQNIVQATLNKEGNYAAAFPAAEPKNDENDFLNAKPMDLSDVKEIEKQLEGLKNDEALQKLDELRRSTKMEFYENKPPSDTSEESSVAEQFSSNQPDSTSNNKNDK